MDPHEADRARESMELRLTLRRLEAAEAALAEARRTLDAVLSDRARPIVPVTPVTPAPVAAVPPPPPPPVQPVTPPKPPVPTETKVIRAVAVTGALITVAGVGLAVTLAIQAGLLGPLGRVLLSALLSVALLGAGLWLDQRRRLDRAHDTAGMTAGVTALIVTSWAVAAVILYALVRVLSWWPPWLGALVAVVLWAVFLAVTVVRHLPVVAMWLGISLLPAATALFDLHAPGTWVTMLMPLMLLAVTRGPAHPEVRIVAAVVAVLQQFWLLTDVVDVTFRAPEYADVSVALLGMVSALAFAALTVWSPKENISADRLTGVVAPLLLLLTATPAAADTWTIWLLVPVTLALAALGHSRGHELEMIALAATAVAFIALWRLTPPLGAGVRADATIVVVLFFAAAVLAVMWLTHREEKSVWPWAFWMGAALILTSSLSRNALAKAPLWLTDNVALIQAVLIGVLLGVTLAHRRAFTGTPVWAQVVFAVVALHLSMVTVVTVSSWLGHVLARTEGMWLGYLTGHALVSILWMVLAAWILLAAPGLSARASLGAGMVLAGTGVIKLVFFDLGALEGLPRAMAFLVSGIALLAMASLRTRRTHPEKSPSREHEQQSEHEEKRATQDQPEDELPGPVTEIDGQVHP